MANHWWSAAEESLGLNLPGSELGFWSMAARAAVVFTFAIVLLRLSDRRSIGHNAGLDVALAVIFGSVLSRAINGSAQLLPSLGAGAIMVMLHRLFGTLAFRSHRISQLMKGRERLLVKDGCVDRSAMRRAKITTDDLLENLRLNGNVHDVAEVKQATLERSGSISVVHVKEPPTTGIRDGAR